MLLVVECVASREDDVHVHECDIVRCRLRGRLWTVAVVESPQKRSMPIRQIRRNSMNQRSPREMTRSSGKQWAWVPRSELLNPKP